MTEIKKEHLETYGFRVAGETGCNPQSFKGYLETIIQGRLVDQSIVQVLSETEKDVIRAQQSNLRNNINELKTLIEKSTTEISTKETTIKKLKQEIEEIKLGKHIEGANKFSQLKFSLNLLFISFLSIYLFLFYVAVIYKTFFNTSIPNPLQGPFPKWVTIEEALISNPLIAVGPIIFFAFGYALHILLEQKGKLKFVYCTLIILVTFLLDFLLAFQSFQKENDIKQMMGLPIDFWGTSPIFYIILFMGFIVYIIWSILLNALIHEWQKKDILGKRVDLIKSYESDSDELNKLISESNGKINAFLAQVSDLQKKIESEYVSTSDIKKCLSQFYIGWTKFGAVAKMEENLKVSEIDYNNIYNNIN